MLKKSRSPRTDLDGPPEQGPETNAQHCFIPLQENGRIIEYGEI